MLRKMFPFPMSISTYFYKYTKQISKKETCVALVMLQ